MLATTVTGSLSLPPLLFLHGFLGCKEDWEEVIAHLKDHFCCYAIDLPGHGSSPYTPNLIQSVHDTFLSLKIPPCPVVGYSMGGRVALNLKEQFPKDFKECVLLAAYPGIADESAKKARQLQDLNWSEMLDTQPFVTFLQAWYAQSIFSSLKERPDLLEKIIERRLKGNPQNMSATLRNFSPALQPTLSKFSSDMLFLYGDMDDKFIRLYQDLPKEVSVDKISTCGHILPLENPKEVAQKIENFLRKNS